MSNIAFLYTLSVIHSLLLIVILLFSVYIIIGMFLFLSDDENIENISIQERAKELIKNLWNTGLLKIFLAVCILIILFPNDKVMHKIFEHNQSQTKVTQIK